MDVHGDEGNARRRNTHTSGDEGRQFGRLTVVVIARTMATFGLATFLAIWVAQRFDGLVAGSAALAVLFGVGL